MVTSKLEGITPEVAQSYLNKSAGNRRLNEAAVLSLAMEMEAGKWVPEAATIDFDVDDRLIDGHHRLNAAIVFGKVVTMTVRRNLPKEARAVIDTNRPRSIVDLFTMYRGDQLNIGNRRAALSVCIQFALGTSKIPPIRTFNAYDAWMRHFKDGIDWVVGEAVAMGKPARDRFRVGYVTGAFAFAHKTNPAKVEAFWRKVATGEGLTQGSSAKVLHQFILVGRTHSGGSGQDKYDDARKVLTAIHHGIKEKPLAKLQTGEVGREFFATTYDNRAMERLRDPWLPDNPEHAGLVKQ